MTTDQLLAAFVSAGVDTPEKVIALLTLAKAQMTRNAKLIALDALKGETATALGTIETKRQGLQAEVDSLTEQIIAAVTA